MKSMSPIWIRHSPLSVGLLWWPHKFESLERKWRGPSVTVGNTTSKPLSVWGGGNPLALLLYWRLAGPYFILLTPWGDIFLLSISWWPGHRQDLGTVLTGALLVTGALSLEPGGKAEGTVRINEGQHAAVSDILARLLQSSRVWVPLVLPFSKRVPSASCWFCEYQISFQ